MSFKKYLLLLLIILLFGKADALEIKKISGPKTSPWIEIYNDSESEKNIEGISLFTNNSVKPSKHGVKVVEGKSNAFIIPPKTYFIIAENPNKKIFDNLNCSVFSSSFSLVIGEVLSYDNIEYTINGVDSIDSTSCSTNIIDNSTSGSSTSSTSTSGATNTKEIIKYIYIPLNNQNIYGDIKVLLPEDKVVPALADTDYTVKVIDSEKKSISGLDFHWSFGDGGEKFGKDVSYHYTYPGEYILIATADGYTSGGQGRMNIKVIKPDLSFSKIGIGGDENYIDLENKTEYDLFLSNFYLKIDGSLYKLPKNLLIPKKKIIHLSGEAIGFKLPANDISLLYPNKNALIYYIKEVNNLINDATNTNLLSATISTNTNTDLDNINIINNNIVDNLITNKLPDRVINRVINNKTIIKNEEIKEKEIKTLSNNNQEINLKTIKRLVLKDNINEKNITKAKIVKNELVKNNNENVDIGIINWFKNLLY